MKLLYQLLLNFFFFIIYCVAGFKIVEKSSYSEFLQLGDSLGWKKFFFVILYFIIVVFVSVATTFMAMAGSRKREMKKGIALDDKDLEVTPDVEIDGKEEIHENLMDIIEDKSGKIIKEPARKPAKKKKKKKGA